MSAAAPAGCPVGRVVTLGAFILDVLGRPVESIPPGQGSVVLQEIRATAARLGTACGSLVATGLGSDAGITSLDDAVSFLGQAEPESAARITERIAARTGSRTVPA